MQKPVYRLTETKTGSYKHSWSVVGVRGDTVTASYETMSPLPDPGLDKETQTLVQQELRSRGWDRQST